MENEQYEENKAKRKKGWVRSLVGWALYAALLLGLIFGTPKALAYALESEYPMAAITSGSMWPALKKGDMVFIQGISGKNDLGVGDIVVYRNVRGFTIHRVADLRESTLVTKGDANNVEDSPIPYEDLIGRTLELRGKPFRVPFLGNVSILFSKFNG